jgi:hypothetical protein
VSSKILIPLASIVVIGTAALLHELAPTTPAVVCNDTKVEAFDEPMKLAEPRNIPPGKFARPPAPPPPPPTAPHPAPSR